MRSVCCAGWPVIRVVAGRGGWSCSRDEAASGCEMSGLLGGLVGSWQVCYLPIFWPGVVRGEGLGAVSFSSLSCCWSWLENGLLACCRPLRRGHGRSSRSGDHHSAQGLRSDQQPTKLPGHPEGHHGLSRSAVTRSNEELHRRACRRRGKWP